MKDLEIILKYSYTHNQKKMKHVLKLSCMLLIMILCSESAHAQLVRLRQLERSPDSLNMIRTNATGISQYAKDTMYFDNDTLYVDVLFYPDSSIRRVHAVEIGGGGGGTVTSVGFTSTDLTVTGSPITTSGTITANIADKAVTFAKIQDIDENRILGRSRSIGTGSVQQILPLPPLSLESQLLAILLENPSRLIGRRSGSAGTAEEIILGTGLSMSGTTLSATNNGTVTSVGISSTDLSITNSPITTSGNIVANINNLAVTTAKLANSAVTTDKINNTAVTNAKLADNAVTTAKIQNSAVTYDKIQNVTSARLLGRHSSGNGVVQEVSIGTGLSLNVSTGVLSATSASNWTLSSSYLYPNSTSTRVGIGYDSEISSSYRLEVNGITYNSSEMYIGGVLSLSAFNRGTLNVRLNDSGVQGGIGFFTQSATSHSLSGLFETSIWGRIAPTFTGTTMTGISNNENNSPLVLEGIANNTTHRFSSIVRIRGSVRSGSGRGTAGSGDTVFDVFNNNTAMFTITGTTVESNAPFVLPNWTTAGRPSTPANGTIGYNTSTGKIEAYAAGAWVNLH